MVILFSVLCVAALIGAVYFVAEDRTDLAAVLATANILFFLLASFFWFFRGYESGRAAGLVESGKYEIVSNEDYSLKELENFLNVNGVYLKEIEGKEIEDGE